jgi:hypothetical protein
MKARDNFLSAVGSMRVCQQLAVCTESSLFSGPLLVRAQFVLQVNMFQFHSITHYEKIIVTNTEKYRVYQKPKLA